MIVGGSLVVGTLIVLGAILPAEYSMDPLGVGKLFSIARPQAPAETKPDPNASSAPLVREYPTSFRTDVIEIPLRRGDDDAAGNELEYKVRMKKDATLVYEWSVSGVSNPEEFYYDFHGHTVVDGEAMTVATYKQATGTHASGALTAPFDGVHGWYLQNQSLKPVVARIKLSGFYELIPCCEPGNESGIIANVPAAEAFGPEPP
jgi:hypothetical protein